jgi:hypothetical protein
MGKGVTIEYKRKEEVVKGNNSGIKEKVYRKVSTERTSKQ